jgi:hypothetical protein
LLLTILSTIIASTKIGKYVNYYQIPKEKIYENNIPHRSIGFGRYAHMARFNFCDGTQAD